ncbi:DEAD/DEAH box helicase [Curtobacterium ammoniigenes]|uniref:DEAD/DEAH box helicase n=1 Tax=Curtobacterium ammoniigenes TaxID=395387 RepID=UPI000829E1AE|nr:DEAD/DEAH box helicase [Curtobacterium ammoniigenes]
MTGPAPRIDAIDIVRSVGPQAFARARDIVRQGLVSGFAFDPALQLVTARVAGTAAAPYAVRITLRPTAHDTLRPVASGCTCPIGSACKHAAAVLLTMNAQAVRSTVDAPDPRDWRAELARLLADADPDAPTQTVPLALQFEVRDVRRTTKLGVRPLVRSANGNWVRGQLTWASLPYSMHRLGLRPTQHAWFMQFAALHRSGAITGIPAESDWLHLDDFASPLLWPLLHRAEELAIPFVLGKTAGLVHVGTEARVLLDATRDGAGSVTVRTTAVLDGRVAPAGRVGVIGDHGLYTWRDQPEARVQLAPAVAPIPEGQRRMLTARERVIVPAEGAEEFVADWSERLGAGSGLVSTDGSLALPGVGTPELVLTVEFLPDERIRLEWRWHVDGRRDPVSMHAPTPDAATLPEPPESAPWFADAVLADDDAIEFAEETLPLLRQHEAFRVVVRGERPAIEHLTELPTLHLTTVESVHRDWFDLSFVVTVQGRMVPFVDVMTALASGRKRLKLIDNSSVALTNPMFDRLRDLIEEARSLAEWEPNAPIRLRPEQVGLWSEFDQLAAESDADDRWRALASGLLAFTDPEAAIPEPAVPAGLTTTLRPYQRDGYAWLTFLAEHGLGGVLADDMGLGKTVQVLAWIAGLRERNPEDRAPFLVVAPTSVVSNWASEARRFVPWLRVAAITATTLKQHDLVATAAVAADIVVTSYALLRLDASEYQAVTWRALVLDEAQFVKNPGSQSHRSAVAVPAQTKIALTGTPLENGLTDLWSLFAIVAPGLLSTLTRFTDDYVKPLASDDLTPEARQARTDRLRRRIRPLMLRRTKAAVATDLPEKQEQVLRLDLDPTHRERYDRTLNRERLKLLDLVDDLDRHRMTVFRSLTLLRMLALSPALVSEADAEIPSAKLDVLLDELAQLASEGRRALVFSQFTSFLRLVGDALDERGLSYEYLDGATRQRQRVVDRFRNGTATAFLISLKAGGFGLNLTEADTVFVLDPWWNPAAENQAVDRAHRIGQRNPVTVIRLIAENTIEEKVLALATQKAALFDAMIDDDQLFAGALTAADVRALLE